MQVSTINNFESSDYCVTTIDLLRHGECEGGQIFRGRTDTPLSENGWQQMRAAVEALKDSDQFPWQQIISSPLQRCAKFSRQLSEQENISLSLNKSFQEMDFGDWDGRLTDEVFAAEREKVEAFWEDPTVFSPPGGESLEIFQTRLQQAWDELIEAHKGQSVLLVCHGGVMRVLIAQLLKMPSSALPRLSVPYGCVSRIQIHHQAGHSDWVQLVFHRG